MFQQSSYNYKEFRPFSLDYKDPCHFETRSHFQHHHPWPRGFEEQRIYFKKSAVTKASYPLSTNQSHAIARLKICQSEDFTSRIEKAIHFKPIFVSKSTTATCYLCLKLEFLSVTPCKNLVYPRKLSFPSVSLMQLSSRD